mmetsp:Transcript_1188/g.3331  ORF Transcript_1188/g.3331 Transcript_1188/m.3331 type:complete len:87 (+) Transcript_1188:254-514(+)
MVTPHILSIAWNGQCRQKEGARQEQIRYTKCSEGSIVHAAVTATVTSLGSAQSSRKMTQEAMIESKPVTLGTIAMAMRNGGISWSS